MNAPPGRRVAGRVPGESYGAALSAPARQGPRVGVLAVQGDVLEHVRMLATVGARGVIVRSVADLDGLDALILPGGESTTIGRILAGLGLDAAIRARAREGLPLFGTCAGAIVLARAALHADGRPARQPLLGVIDVVVRRNAFGRQVASTEETVAVAGLRGGPVHAAFIRAPWFEETGVGVEVLASVAVDGVDRPVVVRQGAVLATAFHPELTGDERLHAAFVAGLGA